MCWGTNLIYLCVYLHITVNLNLILIWKFWYSYSITVNLVCTILISIVYLHHTYTTFYRSYLFYFESFPLTQDISYCQPWSAIYILDWNIQHVFHWLGLIWFLFWVYHTVNDYVEWVHILKGDSYVLAV